jgi:hypothetical protein
VIVRRNESIIIVRGMRKLSRSQGKDSLNQETLSITAFGYSVERELAFMSIGQVAELSGTTV